MERIDIASLSGTKETARYNLLMNYALYKNSYLIENDSSLNIALEYYSGHLNSHEYLLALFLSAEIANNAGNLNKAMSSLTEAHELAKGSDDIYWQAKTAELMADLFRETCNPTGQARYSKEASDLYKKAGKERQHRFTLVDRASALYDTGAKAEALNQLDSIERISTGKGADSSLLAYTLKTKFPIQFESGDITGSVISLEKLIQLSGTECLSPTLQALASRIYIAESSPEKALRHLQIADSLSSNKTDSTNVYLAKAEYWEYFGNLYLTKQYLDSTLSCENIAIREILNDALMESQRDFYDLKSEKEAERARMMRFWLVAACIVTVIIIIAFIMIHRLRMKALAYESELQIADLKSDLALLQTESDKQKSEMKREIVRLFQATWADLNELIVNYATRDGDKLRPTPFILEVRKKIESLLKPGKFDEMERLVDKHVDNVMSKLRKDFPKFKPDSFRILCLLIAGFSASAVSLLLDIKYKTLMTRRSRLIQHIGKSDIDYKEDIWEALHLTPD